ncbi:MAG: signal transduction histidine kinase [Candidatus Azotimanducaceae bacterium]|jgi:signal transduction histidine kinase
MNVHDLQSGLLNSVHARRLRTSILLGLIGFGINYLPVPLFDNMDLAFGNLAFVLVAYFLGPYYAVLTALLTVTALSLSWDDTTLYLWFLPEAALLGYCSSRNWFLLHGNLIYYLVFGVPAAYVLLSLNTDKSNAMVLTIALKQAVNGAAYTALGLFLIPLMPTARISEYLQTEHRHRPLREQLGRSIAALMTLVIILGSLAINFQTIETLRQSARDDLNSTAINLQTNTRNFVNDHLKLISSAAAIMSLTLDDSDRVLSTTQLQQQLSTVHQYYPTFLTMLVADAGGYVTHASPADLLQQTQKSNEEFKVADRDYFQAAFTGSKPYISAVFRGRGFGNAALVAISAPIYAGATSEASASPIGILQGSLDLTRLGDFNQRDDASSHSLFVIIDQHDTIAYAAPELQLPLLSKFRYDETVTNSALPDSHLGQTYSTPSGAYLFNEKTLANQWRVVALEPFEPILEVIQRQFLLSISVLLIALLALNWPVKLLAARLTRPLDQLIDFIHNNASTEVQGAATPSIEQPLEIGVLWAIVADNQRLHLVRQQALESEVALGSQALMDNEQRWKFALESTYEGVWDWDVLRNEVIVSARMNEILGLGNDVTKDTPLNYESLNLGIQIDDLATLNTSLRMHLAGQSQTFDGEYRKRMASGNLHWFHRRGRVVSFLANGEPSRMVGVDRDITERIGEQNAQRRTTKMSALSTLTGGIAHDYNNMLAVILGYTELLDDLTRNNPNISATDATTFDDCLAQIRKASVRGKNLTDRLLTFTQFKPTTIETIDLNELLRSLEAVIKTMLTPKINLTLALETLSGSIELNRADLEDVIINLCLNASHAMPDGGNLQIATHLETIETATKHHQTLQPGTYIQLRLADNGVGMDEETKNRAFDPYFTTREDGIGLGLSQAYGLINGNGGDIAIESEIGNGTTFTLLFPRADQITDALTSAPTPTSEQITGTEHVLIVDDEPDIILLSSRILTQQGYRVSQANSGAEALTLLNENTISLMISDILMPNMNGLQLAKTCETQFPDTKIILVSGYSDEKPTNVNGTQNHAFLLKPYRAKELLTLVRSLLDSDVG